MTLVPYTCPACQLTVDPAPGALRRPDGPGATAQHYGTT